MRPFIKIFFAAKICVCCGIYAGQFMNIVLCGMMGCGKTTVAAALSRLTGMERRDTDEEIVKKYGRIADIFEKYGEARFREIETEEVEELSRLDRLIIATGGGCVLSQKNVEILKRGGKIVFLSTSPEELIARVAGDTERPLLAGGAERRIRELLCVRTPKYLAAADMVTGTDGRSPEDIAAEIAKKFNLI